MTLNLLVCHLNSISFPVYHGYRKQKPAFSATAFCYLMPVIILFLKFSLEQTGFFPDTVMFSQQELI